MKYFNINIVFVKLNLVRYRTEWHYERNNVILNGVKQWRKGREAIKFCGSSLNNKVVCDF